VESCAVGRVDKSYTVLVHLLGPDGQAWVQQDNPPGQGALPKSGWVEGEYIADSSQFVIKSEAKLCTFRF
jgi:hypothetical protein